jgi:hypothetical protein
MEERCHLRSFEDLLYDGVHLLYLAHDVDRELDNDGYEFTYIRSSILNTLLLFECGANCCIDSLDLPDQSSSSLEHRRGDGVLEIWTSPIVGTESIKRSVRCNVGVLVCAHAALDSTRKSTSGTLCPPIQEAMIFRKGREKTRRPQKRHAQRRLGRTETIVEPHDPRFARENVVEIPAQQRRAHRLCRFREDA